MSQIGNNCEYCGDFSRIGICKECCRDEAKLFAAHDCNPGECLECDAEYRGRELPRAPHERLEVL